MCQQTKQHCCHVPRCAAKDLTVGAKSLAHLTPLGARICRSEKRSKSLWALLQSTAAYELDSCDTLVG